MGSAGYDEVPRCDALSPKSFLALILVVNFVLSNNTISRNSSLWALMTGGGQVKKMASTLMVVAAK